MRRRRHHLAGEDGPQGRSPSLSNTGLAPVMWWSLMPLILATASFRWPGCLQDREVPLSITADQSRGPELPSLARPGGALGTAASSSARVLPSIVRAVARGSRPAIEQAASITWGIPPALWRSTVTKRPLGLRSQDHLAPAGDGFEIVDAERQRRRCGRSPAGAATELVEPPHRQMHADRRSRFRGAG